MTKKEIFDKVVETASHVCCVSVDNMMSQRKTDDIVIARAIALFWLSAAKFTTKDVMKFTGKENHQSIDAIRARIDVYWRQIWDFHVLVVDVGERLHEFGLTVGIDFDMWKPVKAIQRSTGRVYY